MLSPEVWEFPPPNSGSRVLSQPPEEKNIKKIRDNSLYHSILILFAGTKQNIPSAIESFFEDSTYYKLSDCSLSELINKTFIEGYIDRGLFSCTSVGADGNIENVITITPEGDFILSLNSHSYYNLGIQGHKLKKSKGESIFWKCQT